MLIQVNCLPVLGQDMQAYLTSNIYVSNIYAHMYSHYAFIRFGKMLFVSNYGTILIYIHTCRQYNGEFYLPIGKGFYLPQLKFS